jgi:hypothetical protein
MVRLEVQVEVLDLDLARQVVQVILLPKIQHKEQLEVMVLHQLILEVEEVEEQLV